MDFRCKISTLGAKLTLGAKPQQHFEKTWEKWFTISEKQT